MSQELQSKTGDLVIKSPVLDKLSKLKILVDES